MEYGAIKHMHATFALLSILLFFARAYARLVEAQWRKHRLFFIGCHSVDSLLLLSAITLLWMTDWAFLSAGWMHIKVLLVFTFIGLGFAVAKAEQKSRALLYGGLNVLVIAGILFFAISKSVPVVS